MICKRILPSKLKLKQTQAQEKAKHVKYSAIVLSLRWEFFPRGVLQRSLLHAERCAVLRPEWVSEDAYN